MSAYTVNIENENRPLERNIFIENENRISISSWYGENHIEIVQNIADEYQVGRTQQDILFLNKKRFLELYEMMTVLKKYIDEGEE